MKEKKPEHLDTLQKVGSILLVIIAVFGAALPIAGFSFSLGYLSNFGIDANTFPQSVGDLWQDSFIVTFLWLPAAAEVLNKYFVPISIILLLLGFIYAALRKGGKAPISKTKYQAIFAKIEFIADSFQKLYGDARLYNIFNLTLLTSLIFFFIFLMFPYMKGEEYAKIIFENYKESDCTSENWSNCVEYSNPNNPLAKSYKGLLVAASSTHIAIFDGEKTSIIPRNPEYVLTRKYKGSAKATEQH